MEDNLKLKELMTQRRTIMQFDCVDGEGWYLSKQLNPIELAKSYHITGDYLLEAIKGDDMEPIATLPIIYIYRHAAELYLKEILRKLGLVKIRGHDIAKLYSQLESVLEKKNQMSLLPDEITFQSFMEFHSISPTSTELRYEDNDLIGGDFHMLFANFENAKFHIGIIKKYFDKFSQNLNLSK